MFNSLYLTGLLNNEFISKTVDRIRHLLFYFKFAHTLNRFLFSTPYITHRHEPVWWSLNLSRTKTDPFRCRKHLYILHKLYINLCSDLNSAVWKKKKKETAIHLINWIEVTLHAVFPKVFFPVYPLLVWYKGCKK